MARRRSSSEDLGCGVLLLVALVFGVLSWMAQYITWYGVGAVFLILTVLIIWALVRRSSISTPKAQNLLSNYQAIPHMSGAQFEMFTAQVLSAMGYRTRVLGGSGDQGVDVIATGSTGKIAVQCKNYSKAVGNKPVQEVYAGARHHGCTEAWVIAPKGYTKGATELARSVNVKLFDENAIRQWIKAVDDAERQAAKQAASTERQKSESEKKPFKPLEL